MKLHFKKLKADKIIRFGTYFSGGIIIFHLLVVLVVFKSLPPLLPLFNQMPWGGDRLGFKIEIFLPLLLSIIFFSLNIYLALRIYEKMPLLSRILTITALLVCILSLIFIIMTIRLVI